jgi:hypothetical protein
LRIICIFYYVCNTRKSLQTVKQLVPMVFKTLVRDSKEHFFTVWHYMKMLWFEWHNGRSTVQTVQDFLTFPRSHTYVDPSFKWCGDRMTQYYYFWIIKLYFILKICKTVGSTLLSSILNFLMNLQQIIKNKKLWFNTWILEERLTCLWKNFLIIIRKLEINIS